MIAVRLVFAIVRFLADVFTVVNREGQAYIDYPAWIFRQQTLSFLDERLL
ncbi:MAG TPA: hypothetical protein VHL08_10840 [Dongiaceae bacterium]|jgi:hypothetical protein|nr:hypothetical protein [Dongiaceae bacterium]